jgi:hypothetical protein
MSPGRWSFIFLDAESEAIFRTVQARLPGYEITFPSTNKNEDKFIAFRPQRQGAWQGLPVRQGDEQVGFYFGRRAPG